MADRKVPLVTGEFYHVYNRGVARQPTFLTKADYEQALLALSYYRFRKAPVRLSRFKEFSKVERERLMESLKQKDDVLVRIVSFVLMPNHFHLLLKQMSDNGISLFLSKFSNSYTKYFNTKRERVGPVFQGVFRYVHIETIEQLIHVSRYIHLNPLISFVVKDADFLSYTWSSLSDFLRGQSSLADLEPILSNFSSPEAYKEFILDHADYAKKLEQIKHLSLGD